MSNDGPGTVEINHIVDAFAEIELNTTHPSRTHLMSSAATSSDDSTRQNHTSPPTLLLSRTPSTTKVASKKYTVIFLDVDGVIFPEEDYERLERTTREQGLAAFYAKPGLQESVKNTDFSNYDAVQRCFFSQRAINRVIELCKNHNAKIVLSSNWRKTSDEKSVRTLADIKKFFEPCGLSPYIIGATPIDSDVRAVNIQSWLRQHDGEIDCALALDDDKSDFDTRLPDIYVECNKQTGFTQACFEKSQQLLDQQKDSGKRYRELELVHKGRDVLTINKAFLNSVCRLNDLKPSEFFRRIKKALKHKNQSIRMIRIEGLARNKHDFIKDGPKIISYSKAELVSLTNMNLKDISWLIKLTTEPQSKIKQICLEQNPLNTESFKSLAQLFLTYGKDLLIRLNSPTDQSNKGRIAAYRMMLENARKNQSIRLFVDNVPLTNARADDDDSETSVDVLIIDDCSTEVDSQSYNGSNGSFVVKP